MAVGGSRIKQFIDRGRFAGLPLSKLAIPKVPRPRIPFRTIPSHGPAQADRAPVMLGQAGTLSVRLATTADDVLAAQRLRFEVFHCGKSADTQHSLDRDFFDQYCDHLLVIDSAGPVGRIVGTYRLLSPEAAGRAGRLYSAGEFDVDGLVARHAGRRFLELGRSCVLPAYRNKRTIDLLWQGIWAYCLAHRIDTLVGCASFSGTQPERHAEALSFLAHHAATDKDFTCMARRGRGVAMDMMPVEAVDMRRALATMPPLVKGYLRLGAMFGHEAVVDADFGTVDVLTVLPVERIAVRYLNHFTPKARQGAEALAA